MFGQARDICGLGFDVVVAAAVAGALGAVVGVFSSHDANFKLFDADSKGLCVSNHDESLACCVKPELSVAMRQRFLAGANDETNRGPSRSDVAAP